MKPEKEQAYLDRIAELEKELKRTHHKIKKDTYGLHWLDVPEAFEDDVENKLPILKEVKDKAIVNDDGKPTHILIEGDNYHALTCLNYSHKGKIDLIYIDPPYNTGTDGFRYKDKRFLTEFPDGTDVPKDHPLRHSYWLSFMAKRLKLCKDLLKESGVIFISIDDNENAQLKLLCDMIFFPSNYVGTITWERKRKGSHLSKKLTKKTEFIHIYAKSGPDIELFGTNVGEDEDSPLIKRTNSQKTLTVPNNLINTKLKDGVYRKGKYGYGSSSVELLEDVVIENNKFKNDLIIKGPFVWTQKNLEREVNKGAQFFIKTKRFSLRVLKGDLSLSFKALSSLFTREIGTNEDAKTELSNILGVPEDELKIDYPKPVSLIKKIIQTKTNENGVYTILDFFAGSGTTGQAAMELCDNEKSVQCILVTNDENGIMTEVCYPRICNVIKGYKFKGKYKETLFEKKLNWTTIKNSEETIDDVEKIINENNDSNKWDRINKEVKNDTFRLIGEKEITDEMPGLGNSLKYYKTEFVGYHNILGANDQDKSELAHHVGEMLAIAENTLYEMDDLQTDFYQFFRNEKHYTAVYFREELEQFEVFREKVMALDKPVSVYVFSWGENEFADQFEDRNDIEVKPIPQPILEMYKTIYNLSN